MEEQLRKLKLKKALLVDQMLMLSSIGDKFYLQLGKVETEIILLELKIIQAVENDLD
jgi:hypothetical protein